MARTFTSRGATSVAGKEWKIIQIDDDYSDMGYHINTLCLIVETADEHGEETDSPCGKFGSHSLKWLMK